MIRLTNDGTLHCNLYGNQSKSLSRLEVTTTSNKGLYIHCECHTPPQLDFKEANSVFNQKQDRY